MPGTKKGNGSESKRTPFVDREKENAYALFTKAAVNLKHAKQAVKDYQEQYDKLLEAVERGGYLNDAQLGLPLAHPNDVLDEESPPIWLRAHNEATYHLYPLDGESAHCDAALPAERILLRADQVAPTVERLCPECCSAPYPAAIADAKVLFGKVGDKPPASPMASARAQAKKKGAGTNGTAEKR